MNLNYILPKTFFGVIPLYIGVEVVLGIAILNKAAGFYGFLSIITGHPINFFQWLYNVLELICIPFYVMALGSIKHKPKNGRKFSLACILYCVDTVVGGLFTLYFVWFWFSNEEVVNNKRALEDFGDLELAEGPVVSSVVAAAASATAKLLSGTTSIAASATAAAAELSGGGVITAGYVTADYASPTGVSTGATVPGLLGQSQLAAREIFMTSVMTILITLVRFYFTLVMVSFTRLLLKQLKIDEQYDVKDEDEERVMFGTGKWNAVERKVLHWENKAKQFLTDKLL